MTPSVDWVRFLALMEGQCEPGFSSYEISKKRVRLADIDPELWFEEGVTRVFTAPVNIIEGEEVTGTVTRTVTTPYTHEEAARAMSDWRVTQRESVLEFPCHPSDVKRWAEEQFLEVGQDLEDACNDETRERLAEEAATSQAAEPGQAAVDGRRHRGNGHPEKRRELVARIIEILRELDPGLDPNAMPGRKRDFEELCQALDSSLFIFGEFRDALHGQAKFCSGARETDYYQEKLPAVRQQLGEN